MPNYNEGISGQISIKLESKTLFENLISKVKSKDFHYEITNESKKTVEYCFGGRIGECYGMTEEFYVFLDSLPRFTTKRTTVVETHLRWSEPDGSSSIYTIIPNKPIKVLLR